MYSQKNQPQTHTAHC